MQFCKNVLIIAGLVSYASIQVSAQNLPLDPAVKTGKLANGFTYYIRRNTEPKDRVVFYLVNKVGSMQEEENQRGLAHFLEHMSFNGTKHYPRNELVEYLQKAGVRFGADLNAFTSFTETVYQLPLPADDPAIVKNGLQIMRDWAAEVSLDSMEIEKERGVVLEEKRMRNGAGQRMQDKSFPIQVNNSMYAKRVPIGTEAVLKRATGAMVRKFYHDWYRPDLQALIVVGDIDVNELENQVKALFGNLKKGTVRPPQSYSIPLTGKNQFISLTDPEQTETLINILIKQSGTQLKTKADYRNSIVQSLFNAVIGARLQEVSQRPDPPFVFAQGYSGEFLGGLNALNVDISPKPARLKEALVAVWTEFIRLKKYGPTKDELSRAKTNYSSGIENAFNELGKTPSESFVQEYTQHFLKGTAAPGIAKEYELAIELLEGITLGDLNSFAKKAIKHSDRDIIIMAAEKDKLLLPGEIAVNRWMNEVEIQQLEKWKEQTGKTNLITMLPVSGYVVSREMIDTIGVVVLTLNNGMKALLKPTTFRNNEIYFSAVSEGGTSVYPDIQFLNARNAATIISNAGLGDFSPAELEKLLAGKSVQVAPYINEMNEGLNGSSTVKDFETALQLAYLYFTAPRKDSILFRNLISQGKTMLANRGEDPNMVLQDSITMILSGNHYRGRPQSVSEMDSLSMEETFRIFRERFQNAADFTFIFTGSLDTAIVVPLIAKYLGAIPSTGKQEKAKDVGIKLPKGQISRIIQKGKDDKAVVNMVYSGSYIYNEENNIQLNALGAILQYRMTERVRELEGGAYSPGAGVSMEKLPNPQYLFFIRFICAPENADKLIAAASEEIEKLRNGNITSEDIAKFTAETVRVNEVNLRSNGYWNFYMQNALINGESPVGILNSSLQAKNVSIQSVSQTAKTYLDPENFIKVVLIPEQ